MKFNEINTRADALEYANKIGGVPRVPFSIFWEFYPEDEEKLVNVARQVQQVFNLVQSTEPFKIEVVEEIEEDLFDITINPGGAIPFRIDQDNFEQQKTARKIDEQLDAHQKKKEQKAPSEKKEKVPSEKKEKVPSEKKQKTSSEELYNEFKEREEKILAEIRAEVLIKAKAEAEALVFEALAKAKAEVAKAEAKAAKAKKENVVTKTTTLKLFGYSIFEFSK